MRFNDDDFYLIDLATNKIIGHWGSKCVPDIPKVGQILVKGMRAKYMPLN